MSSDLCWELSCPGTVAVLYDKILGQSRFKEFPVSKISMTQKMKFVLGRVQNIVGKGENKLHA